MPECRRAVGGRFEPVATAAVVDSGTDTAGLIGLLHAGDADSPSGGKGGKPQWEVVPGAMGPAVDQIVPGEQTGVDYAGKKWWDMK